MSIQMQTSGGGNSSSLIKAILLYGDKENINFVSLNEVGYYDNEATKPYIGAGIPASQQAIISLINGLKPTLANKKTVLPSNILSYGYDHIAWYTLPGKKHLWFKNEEFGGNVNATVDLPGLVFYVSNGEWFVFAHKLNVRPSADTPLYVSPFLNVWDGGKICTGNIKVPNIESPSSTEAFEEAFFRSYFTHMNIHGKNKLVKYKGGPYEMWKHLITGQLKKFPKTALVPFSSTVGEFLEKFNTGG